MRLITASTAAAALFLCAAAHANYLTYVDENGTKHVVQSSDDIPEKYRKDVKPSSAGASANTFYKPDVPYAADPKDPPRVSCEKEANYNFEQVKKKLFRKEEGALGPEEMKAFTDLMSQRERDKAACKRFPEPIVAEARAEKKGEKAADTKADAKAAPAPVQAYVPAARSPASAK